jgi:hypothetical protein
VIAPRLVRSAESRLDRERDAAHVRCPHAVELRDRAVAEAALAGHAGVAHEAVEPSVGAERGIDHGAVSGFLREVGHERRDRFVVGRDGLDRGGAVHCDDRPAVGGQAPRRRSADPRRGPRDDRDLVS